MTWTILATIILLIPHIFFQKFQQKIEQTIIYISLKWKYLCAQFYLADNQKPEAVVYAVL